MRPMLTLMFLAGTAVMALDGARLLSPVPQKRTAMVAGGWSANAYNNTCPTGSTGYFIGGCCPNSLTCQGTGDPVNVVCCPADVAKSDCFNTFSYAPTCADSSWTLWNSTTQGQYDGFFCCDQGQVGDTQGGCTSIGVSDDVSSAISVMPATVTATPTATKGIGGLISSAIASVTFEVGSSKSSSAACGGSRE